MRVEFGNIFNWTNTKMKHIPKRRCSCLKSPSPHLTVVLTQGTNIKSELNDKSWKGFLTRISNVGKYDGWKCLGCASTDDTMWDSQPALLQEYRRYSVRQPAGAPSGVQTIQCETASRRSFRSTDDTVWDSQPALLQEYRRYSVRQPAGAPSEVQTIQCETASRRSFRSTDDTVWDSQPALLQKYRRYSVRQPAGAPSEVQTIQCETASRRSFRSTDDTVWDSQPALL